jgi:hypothetical protein
LGSFFIHPCRSAICLFCKLQTYRFADAYMKLNSFLLKVLCYAEILEFPQFRLGIKFF